MTQLAFLEEETEDNPEAAFLPPPVQEKQWEIIFFLFVASPKNITDCMECDTCKSGPNSNKLLKGGNIGMWVEMRGGKYSYPNLWSHAVETQSD